MTRRIFLLMGIAIIGVVVNHAAAWGQIAMFWWADRYRAVAAPNFDQVGSLTYYVLLVARQLTLFSVPAFLFVAGFFTSFMAHRRPPMLVWRTSLLRIRNITIPYLIWSAVIFGGELLQGVIREPLAYARAVLTSGAIETYFYVPVLCGMLLLSPLLVSLSERKPQTLLLITGVIQLATMAVRSVAAADAAGDGMQALARLLPEWLFIRWIFFFALGLVCFHHLPRIKPFLERYRYLFLGATVISVALKTLESDLAFRQAYSSWGPDIDSILFHTYTLGFILCFVAFDQLKIPASRTLHSLGAKTLGIYLIHMTILELASRVVRQVAPDILALQYLFLPLLVLIGLGVPLLFMQVVVRSPGRRLYPYLFG